MGQKLEMFLEMVLSEPQVGLFLYRDNQELEDFKQALQRKERKLLSVHRLNEVPQTPCIALCETSLTQLMNEWQSLTAINEMAILLVALNENDLNGLGNDAQDQILQYFSPIFRF